jgi:hypothetical protein
MAGGIDWFRWHHGSVTDPKFQLVAKKAGARLGDVITVWAFVLEAASSHVERGTVGAMDFETLDFLLGAEEGTAMRILDAMTQRGLIEGDQVAQWNKRQPKREREDNGAADRKRAQRERQTTPATVTPSNQLLGHVTPCHAMSHQKTPREEESREEEIHIAPNGARLQPSASDTPACPYEQIVSLYHDKLAELPGVRVMDDKRKRKIKSFWVWVLTSKRSDGQRRANGADQALTWIGQYFERASANDFVMGRSGRNGDHRNWRADIEYLCGEAGRKQVIEKTVDHA